jgi:two-component system, chemotaxis family, chemotaxis protein CheY
MTTRILTVDDSPTIRAIVGRTLTEAGYEVFQAEDGRRGLDCLSFFKPAMVITDLNMNVMSGFTFVKALRNDCRFRDLPVIFLTTQSDEEAREHGRAIGATGWMTKPVDPEKLIRVVRRIVGEPA